MAREKRKRIIPRPAGVVAIESPANSPMPTVPVASGGEVIDALRGDDQPIYDRQTYLAAANPQLEMLQFNLGQNNVRGFTETNVPDPNRLPGEWTMSVRGIAIHITTPTGAAVNPVDLFNIQRGLFTLYKNSNRRFQLRVGALGGGRFSGVGQGLAGLAFLQNGSPSINDHYHLKSAIPLQAEDDFNASIRWPEPGINLNEDVEIEVILYGLMAGLADRF